MTQACANNELEVTLDLLLLKLQLLHLFLLENFHHHPKDFKSHGRGSNRSHSKCGNLRRSDVCGNCVLILM